VSGQSNNYNEIRQCNVLPFLPDWNSNENSQPRDLVNTHKERMNIAILGPGGIADDAHAPAVNMHPDAKLWSVLSRSRDRAEQFARNHDLASPSPTYTDLDELLHDPDLDAVIVATPDRLHSEQVLKAAKAGKHILLEKPMATSVSECDAMMEACHANNVTLAMAYHLRWHAGHRQVREQVVGGAFGQLRHVRVHWTFQVADDSNWRSSPQTGRWWALAANGTHCLDFIRWIMCPSEGEVVDVRCMINRAKFGSPHDETAIVLLSFESGSTAEFCVSVQFESASRIEIYGDDSHVRMEGTMGRHGAGSIFHGVNPVSFEIQNPFLGELNNFIEAVREGRPAEVDGIEGRRNVEILTRAIKSSGADNYQD